MTPSATSLKINFRILDFDTYNVHKKTGDGALPDGTHPKGPTQWDPTVAGTQKLGPSSWDPSAGTQHMGPSHFGPSYLGPGTRDPRPKVMSNLVFVNLGWVPGPGSRKGNLLRPVPFPGPGTQNPRSQDPGPRSRKRNLLSSGPGTWDPGSRNWNLFRKLNEWCSKD